MCEPVAAGLVAPKAATLSAHDSTKRESRRMRSLLTTIGVEIIATRCPTARSPSPSHPKRIHSPFGKHQPGRRADVRAFEIAEALAVALEAGEEAVRLIGGKQRAGGGLRAL